ncbi:hypothetical protein PMAYCL1PPCAC_26887, partial [Pristionchus mayeri]
LWRNFEKSINSISKQTGIVGGLFGQNLDLMRKLTFELGNALYTHFAGTWGEGTNGKSIVIQQASAFEACKELQRSLGFIMDIHRFKHTQHLESIESRKNSTTIPNGKEYVLLPTFEAPNEIKEELVETKDEPIDSLAEIKHEEPVADV